MKNILWKYFRNPNLGTFSIMSRHISELARGMAEKKKYGDVEFNEQQMEEFRLVAKKTHFLTFFTRFFMIVACLCFGKHYFGNFV